MPLISTTQTRAVTVSLVIQQGSDFSHTISLQNSDGSVFVISGYTGKMQIREIVGGSTVLAELSTANGRISINGLAGQLTLSLTNIQTAAMTWRSGVYDLEITSAGSVITRIMEGRVTLSPEVTI